MMTHCWSLLCNVTQPLIFCLNKIVTTQSNLVLQIKIMLQKIFQFNGQKWQISIFLSVQRMQNDKTNISFRSTDENCAFNWWQLTQIFCWTRMTNGYMLIFTVSTRFLLSFQRLCLAISLDDPCRLWRRCCNLFSHRPCMCVSAFLNGDHICRSRQQHFVHQMSKQKSTDKRQTLQRS